MYRSNRSLFSYLFLGIAVAIACGPQPIEVPEDEDDDDDNGGGNSGTGATGFGGSFGGTYPSGGGTVGVGGTPPAGGTPGTGGFAGVQATGGIAGVQATGGAFPMGGAAGVSGTPATGGVAGVATGGVAGTVAGAAGAGGGGMVSCDAAFAVGPDGFVRAPAATGCWHGYAFAGGDVGSTVMPTSFGTCGMPCMLRASGTVGPATAANSYAGVVYLGFNINQASGSSTFAPLAPTGTGLAVTFTKAAGPATIRVQIQAGSSRWCANLATSGAVIPYTMFNTQCWDMMGTAYAKQPIEAVQLVIPGPDATAGVAFDMTLVSVKDM